MYCTPPQRQLPAAAKDASVNGPDTAICWINRYHQKLQPVSTSFARPFNPNGEDGRKEDSVQTHQTHPLG